MTSLSGCGKMLFSSYLHKYPSMTLKDKLLALGYGGDEIREVILQNIYPLHARVWWQLRKNLGLNPFTAEREFIDDLANSRSGHEVEYAFSDYRGKRSECKTWLMKPSRIRVNTYFLSAIKH